MKLLIYLLTLVFFLFMTNANGQNWANVKSQVKGKTVKTERAWYEKSSSTSKNTSVNRTRSKATSKVKKNNRDNVQDNEVDDAAVEDDVENTNNNKDNIKSSIEEKPATANNTDNGEKKSNSFASDMFRQIFLNGEATYQNQKIQFPRSSKNRPLTIGYQIKNLFGDNLSFTDAYVCVSSTYGVNDTIYTSPDELLDRDVVTLAIGYSKDGNLFKKYDEPNTTIYLGYNSKDGEKRYLTIHARTRGMLNRRLYTRMTFFYPGKNEDDCVTYQSRAKLWAASYMTVFDVTDPTEDLNYYESVYSSMYKHINHDEDLTKNELYVFEGLYEICDSYYNNGYAKWLYKDSRYLDAIEFFEMAYQNNRTAILNGSRSQEKVFYEACEYLGRCYDKMGVKDKAEYFMGLAAYSDNSKDNDLANISNASVNQHDLNNYQFVDAQKKVDLNSVSVGQILNSVFDVFPEYIQNGKMKTWGADSRSLSVQEAWDINLKSLCLDKPTVITLPYSKVYYQTNSEVDKSILLFSNVITITINRASQEKQLWRVNVMIPNFKMCDYNREQTELNKPLLRSFIIGNSDMEWDLSDFNDIFSKCMTLKGQGRCTESMNGLKYTYSSLKQKYSGQTMSSKVKSLFMNAGFEYGFALSELECPVKAFKYLAENLEVATIRSREEFINTLSGLKDVRTLDIIDAELTAAQTYLSKHKDSSGCIDYKNFLLRRKAYVLIDQNRLDEAEAILEAQMIVLKDKTAKAHAQTELNYIKDLKNENKTNAKGFVYNNGVSYKTNPDNLSCRISKVTLTDEYTIIELDYINQYEAGGWCSIDPDAFIRDRYEGKTYRLIRAEGIPVSPDRHTFEKKYDSLHFRLIFPAVSSSASYIDLLESRTSHWRFYNIKIR